MSHQIEIQVMSSAAFMAAYLALVPAFERTSGHTVATRWIPGVDLLKRVREGESSDLVILQAGDIDALIAAGRIRAGSRVDLARSGVGVAVRAGAAKPDISSAAALTRTLRAAKSVAYSTGPSGVYILKLFERLGVADEVRVKARQVKGEPVAAVVARGEAEIGFQQVSELLPVPGIDFLGPLPDEIQQITIFATGVQTSAPAPAAAKLLMDFLTSPAAAPAIRASGMEPA